MTHQFWNHQGTQDTLAKVLINVALGSFLTALVLYLVLHQGAGMWTQVGCILQGEVRTKLKTPGTGEIMVEEAMQTSTWRGCANSYMERLCKLHNLSGFKFFHL
jgi:hypothetical protein